MKVEWHAPTGEAPPARILFFGRNAGRALLQIRVESTDATKDLRESSVDVELSHRTLFGRRVTRSAGRVASNGFVAFALEPKDARDAEQQIQPFDASRLAVLRATIRVGDAPATRLTAASWKTRALCIGGYAIGLLAVLAHGELWVRLVDRGAVPLQSAAVVLSLAFAVALLALLSKPNRLGAFLLRPHLATLAALSMLVGTTAIERSATEVRGVAGTNIERGVHAFGLPEATASSRERLCGTSIRGLDECECPEKAPRGVFARAKATIACKRRWQVPAEARLAGAESADGIVCIDPSLIAGDCTVKAPAPTATLDAVALRRLFALAVSPHTQATITHPANEESLREGRRLRVRSSTYVGPAVVESDPEVPSLRTTLEANIVRGDMDGVLPISWARNIGLRRNGQNVLPVSCPEIEEPMLLLFERSPSGEVDRTANAFPRFEVEAVGAVAPALARDGSGLAAVCIDPQSDGEELTIAGPTQSESIALPFSARSVVVKDASRAVEGKARCAGEGPRNRLRRLSVPDHYRGRVKGIQSKDGQALWRAERDGVAPRVCIDELSTAVDVMVGRDKRPGAIVGEQMTITSEEKCVKAAEKRREPLNFYPCGSCANRTWFKTLGDVMVYACEES